MWCHVGAAFVWSYISAARRFSRELDQPMLQVDDPVVRRLAGVEAYSEQDVKTGRPLLDHTAEQLENMLSRVDETTSWR